MRPLPGSIRVVVCLFVCIFTAGVSGQEASKPFEILEGDRVLFLGDTLLEREGNYGFLETRMHEQFPNRKFTVRNLSYSADTPKGLSRSVFDAPEKGWERLKEQIAMVKPTLVFLGYGMASSLDFAGSLTDRMAEPKRSAQEKAARFRKEMEELMDVIEKTDPATKPRFVLLAPIQHEDRRSMNPAAVDPAMHNQALGAIRSTLQELSTERNATYIDLNKVRQQGQLQLTDNGIHPTETGLRKIAEAIGSSLGWVAKASAGSDSNQALRTTIQRKNELFFHRWRPQNQTYLFGFRKHEQGQNAKEIPMFDPLVDAAEAEIDQIKRGNVPANTTATKAPPAAVADATSQPQPQFDVQEGYEISLWAENPLLEKPVQMNWDSQGRLWVASSSVYPQIEPGAPARDKILILEDTDRNGTPDKSTVFADGLLIPTAVIADVVPAPDADGKVRGTSCYVGQSTELLRLTDTDGDGKADKREVVLSGFGTEDTHHILHTLRWGPDGRLYFNQSIYIHTHTETPWGVVRQNSGGVLALDPHSQRLEVMYNGFWNPWGTAWDKAGQAFITDGAGSQGVAWGIRGAAYATYEGSRRLLQSVSPGSYPKFCGLEMIYSPHFPQEWQNTLVTCDFRAHRIVHFALNNLSTGENPTSGYITKELPDIARTNDVSFRPIDVKLGPDGALYVADWSNPVINHGEVDFRDPRRDKTRGRIWRIAKKNAPLAEWKPLTGLSKPELQARLNSPSQWERTQAARLAGSTVASELTAETAAEKIADANPRVRLLAMRALAAEQSLKSAELVLEAALRAPANDPYYEYAAWLSINDLAEPWSKAILSGQWQINSPAREKQLQWALNAVTPARAEPILTKVMENRQIPQDGTGPWIELIGKAGDQALITRLYTDVTSRRLSEDATVRALDALMEATRLRNLRPKADLAITALPLLTTATGSVQLNLVRALGAWKEKKAVPSLLQSLESDSVPLSTTAGLALVEISGEDVKKALADLTRRHSEGDADHVFQNAVQSLAQLDPKAAAPYLSKLFAEQTTKENARSLEIWRNLLKIKGGADVWATLIPADLPVDAATAGLRAAREQGKRGERLAAVLAPLAGTKMENKNPAANFAATAERAKRDGDPSRGEEIYRRAQLGCVTCHAIGGAGGKVGPELTSLGASAPLDYIIESTLAPAVKVKEGYHAVNLTLKDGTVASGVHTMETPDEIILRNVIGQEVAVAKSKIASKEDVGSLMPAGIVDTLAPREQLDLFAFLSQLGKPGVYDASKGTVARVWKLLPAADLAKAIGDAPDLSLATNAFTNVDGRISREQLQAALQLIPNASEGVVALSKFQLPAAGKATLTLSGISEAWLNGKPLAIASEPKVAVELPAGEHVLAVKLNPNQLPSILQVASQEVRFLTE